MKQTHYIFSFLLLFSLSPLKAISQTSGTSYSTGVRIENAARNTPRVRDEKGVKQDKVERIEENGIPDASVGWTRIIYKILDLEEVCNATLGFPEDSSEGSENFFRIIMRLLTEGTVQGYEFLDGKEVFTPEFKVNVVDMLDRFHIPYSNENGKVSVAASDVPSNEVSSYYIIEKWEFDTRQNRTLAKVIAVCPVIHGGGYFEEEETRYPVAWFLLEDLRPYLAQSAIFVSDDDNTPRYTYDDFFTLNLYKGEIYKTRNLRNKTMAQLYPEESERKHAADSIQQSLENFDKLLWTPSREEVMEARKAREEKAGLGEVPARSERVESARKPARRTSRGSSTAKGNNSTVVRSVKDRK